MPKFKNICDPELFATGNIYPPEKGEQHVEVYIKVKKGPEGAKMGLALDGSNSMKEVYGAHIPDIIRPPDANIMQPVAKKVAAFLRGFDADGAVTMINWAVGTGGKEIEVIGVIDEAAEATLKIEGPTKPWGGGTKLAPPITYFANEFKDAAWALVLFITDGEIEDMTEVKDICTTIGKEISAGKRKYLKLVIIGAGPEVNIDQLEVLGDMFEGSGIKDPNGDALDLWDYNLVSSMKDIWEILKEVDFGIDLPGICTIKDENGKEVLSYTDGFPMKLDFQVFAGCMKINIDIGGKTFEQSLEV